MQVYEIYEDLYKHCNEELEIPISITLETIASLLGCSKRNANFVLKRLLEKGWISWYPGKGRGKISAIEFHFSIQDMYIQIAKEKVKNGDIGGSIRFIEHHVKDIIEKEKYFQWLNHSFGVLSDEITSDKVDTLRIPMIKEIGSLDPILTTCGIEAHLVKHIFDTLVVFNPEKNQIDAGLAHFWESKNGLEWKIYLRKGVYFHDGNECTSKDVLYTLQRLRQQPSLYSWMVTDIEDIEIVNTWTIRIRFSRSNPYFLHYLASHPLSIIQKNSLSNESFTPIGTGPFKVAQNDLNKLILQANSYHFVGRPFLDKIELWKTVENANSLNGVRPDVFQLEKLVLQKTDNQEKNLQMASHLENGCKLITFNLNMDGPHQNKLFRKAMEILFQREPLINMIHWERYYPAYSLLPREDTIEEFHFDYKAAARHYLQESGYAGESIVLYCSNYHENDALLLQNLCKEIGINLVVRFLQKQNDAPYPKQEDAQLILFECLFDHDITFSLLEIFMTEDGYIRRHLPPNIVSDIENKIYSHIHGSDTEKILKEILDEIEKNLLEEITFICLYRRIKTIQYSEALAGIQIDPLGWVNFKKIWCL